MTKISILLQYQRLFSNTMIRKVILVGLVFLTCWGITLCFLLPLVCIPVAAFWDPNVHGFCLDNGTIWYIMAAVNVFTDFAVFTMPIPVISSLHLPTKQKAMLLIVFMLGIL
jgi:c-di-AMP phosphodiesterase-like protein